jgi:hypothetical protein
MLVSTESEQRWISERSSSWRPPQGPREPDTEEDVRDLVRPGAAAILNLLLYRLVAVLLAVKAIQIALDAGRSTVRNSGVSCVAKLGGADEWR